MDFSLSEEQELLLASIRELITRSFPEAYFKRCDETRTFPHEFFNALAESGIGLLGIPEEFGGGAYRYDDAGAGTGGNRPHGGPCLYHD